VLALYLGETAIFVAFRGIAAAIREAFDLRRAPLSEE
jgi:hypothetical protein